MRNQVSDLTEIAQLLACENCDEALNFVVSQASPKLRKNKDLLKSLLLCRADFEPEEVNSLIE